MTHPRGVTSAGARIHLASAVFALLVLAVYAEPVLKGRTFAGRDQIAYNLPMAQSIHRAYARGRLPVWTPEISGGRPLLPNPNVGALYPARALLSVLPFPFAMRLYPVLHWALAGIGVILLLHATGASTGAAWIGAVTYVFSGVGVSEAFFPHLQPGMTWLPWVLWRCERLRGGKTRSVLGLAVVLALDFLAGDVFTGALALFCAALWLVLGAPRDEKRGSLLRLSTAVGIAALAAAPQIVATALWVPETHRAVVGMNVAEATGFSLSPWRLIELIVPYPFGETWRLETAAVWGRAAFAGKAFGFFLTIYCGALSVIALAALWRSREFVARYARILFLLAATAAMIPSLLPASWGKMHSPLPLRNPEKLSVALMLSLAILSARALDLYRAGRPRVPGLAVAAALAMCACAFALSPGSARRVGDLFAAGRLAGAAAAQLPFALAEAGLLWIATILALETLRSRARGSLPAACALLTLVPILANRRILETCRDEEAFAPTPFARRLARLDPGGHFRTLGESLYRPPPSGSVGAYVSSELGFSELPRRTWVEYTQLFWNRGTVFNEDFDVGDLARVESLRRVSARAAGFRDSAPFFENLSLRWGIRYRGQPPVASFRAFGGDPLQEWDEQSGALPDVRLATSWIEEPSALAALNRLGRLRRGELVVETGRSGKGAARAGALQVLEKTAERLRIVTMVPDPTWLFVLRAFWSHRTVEIDGQESETVPAYLAYTAVRVPAGKHRVEWRERVPGGRVSIFGPALAIVAAALLTVSHHRRRTR